MSVNPLPDVPLDVPLTAPPHRFRRPALIAPAPRWAAPFYLLAAACLVPWIVYLSFALPEHATAGHWDAAWIGFDAMEFCSFAGTAYLAYRRSTWVDILATATAVLMIVDAWFDITTANTSWELIQAIVLAVVAELPLAALSLWIARHAQIVNAAVTRWLYERSVRQSEQLSRHGNRDAPLLPDVAAGELAEPAA